MNFMDALNSKKANEVEKPALLPVGTYLLSITKAPSVENSKDGAWSFFRFPFKVVSAGEDVDPDDLEAFGSPSGFRGGIQFMAPNDEDKVNDQEQALYNIRRFCEDVLGLEPEDDETLMELAARAANSQFYGLCKHEARKDNGDMQVAFNAKDCAAV